MMNTQKNKSMINDLIEFRKRRAAIKDAEAKLSSDEIAQQTAEFLARGGEIQQLSSAHYTDRFDYFRRHEQRRKQRAN